MGVGEIQGPSPTRLVRAGISDIDHRFKIVDLPRATMTSQFQGVETTSPEPCVSEWFDGEFWRVHAETVYVSGASLVSGIDARLAPLGAVARE